MGSKQASYALDFIADVEVDLKKLTYKSEGMTIDTFYERDPVNFLLYNIIDTTLCVRLNEKLHHIESYNMLRRLMKTPFTAALRGSSILFDTYVNFKLNEEEKYTRFGILDEVSVAISDDEISTLYIPKQMKRTAKEISQQTFRTITGHFPGAYVKQSHAQILTSKDGIIVDLDAKALYPSMLTQLNIGFDTFFGKIIDPVTYNFLDAIGKPLNAKMPIPQNIFMYLYEMITKYADKLKPQNKAEYVQNCYLIMAYLLKKLETHKKTLDQLFKQETLEDYIVLRRIFLPMVDLFDDIHPNSKEYNSFCNEYLINDSLPPKLEQLYIIEDILKPTIRIIKIPIKTFGNYLKSNNLILSLSGCLFLKHEVKRGLFIDFLRDLTDMRGNYDKKKLEFEKGSDEYDFYDMRQKAIKVTMNTLYGLYGQQTYRFSNKQLAKSITVQGRLSLKATQLIAEMYLEALKGAKQ
jgi:DNA polymerase elongation subunit (family B)